jgi:hypothetical protein
MIDPEPRRRAARMIRMFWLPVLMAAALGGCATATRMDAKFNREPAGSAPPQAPSPNPPADQFTWLVRQPLKSVVVVDPAGGAWVQVTPTGDFLVDPGTRRNFVIGTSEPFKTDPVAKIRGHVRLQISGLGVVSFALQPMVQGQLVDGYLGGGEVGSFIGGTGSPGAGSTAILASFPGSLVASGQAFPATGLSAYAQGRAVELFWTLDQTTHTFTLGDGTNNTSVRFPADFRGVATTPIQQLSLWMWLKDPTGATKVFVDDFWMEEFK